MVASKSNSASRLGPKMPSGQLYLRSPGQLSRRPGKNDIGLHLAGIEHHLARQMKMVEHPGERRMWRGAVRFGDRWRNNTRDRRRAGKWRRAPEARSRRSGRPGQVHLHSRHPGVVEDQPPVHDGLPPRKIEGCLRDRHLHPRLLQMQPAKFSHPRADGYVIDVERQSGLTRCDPQNHPPLNRRQKRNRQGQGRHCDRSP